MQSPSWKKTLFVNYKSHLLSYYYLMTPDFFRHDNCCTVITDTALAKKEQIVKNLLIHDNIVTLHVFVMSLILKHESLVNEHLRRQQTTSCLVDLCLSCHFHGLCEGSTEASLYLTRTNLTH